MAAVLSIDGASAQWLTDVLRRAGVLERGAVVAVERAGNPAFNSAVTHLRLSYSPDAPAEAPRRLLLKRNGDSAWSVRAGANEVSFYTLAAAERGHLPMLVTCYDAAYDEQSGQSHLLLDDVSATHAAPVTRDQLIALQGIPSPAHLDGVIEAVARFHACWWEHPALGSGIAETSGWYREDHVARRRADWAAFSAAAPDWFPDDLRALYEMVLDGFPRLWQRLVAPRVATLANLTLGHGDCYFSQFLCPKDEPKAEATDESKDEAPGQTYVVDFQNAGADFCGIDLVHLFATFWTPAQRQDGQREERALHRYHGLLRSYGVAGYSWDDLLADYRIALAYMIFYPVWDQTNGSSQSYWWPKMQCLTAAYRDWRCHDLLQT